MGKTRGARHRKRKQQPKQADTADRHYLYEQSVQGVEHEAEFLADTFKEIRGREATLLREDFCGTANAACEWVKVDERHRAICVDLDADVLAYGRKKHVSALSPDAQQRITLINGDVLIEKTEPADILAAFNFSYFIFKTREELRRYFSAARDAIKDDGLFFLDIYGGSDAYQEMEEETEYDDFTYIWDQASYDPVTGDYLCYIHFRFADGSELTRAFTYHWRLWSVPEVRELLAEAGFSSSKVYWEGTDEDGEGDGVFTPVETGEADEAFVSYIVARP
ncbi:MAG: class I SAM-dependent methyltransferase [Gammaproteobacteria bacterium]|nr:class I SAM-dependent methyltransferase [Gammaproteobacteria bacterium]